MFDGMDVEFSDTPSNDKPIEEGSPDDAEYKSRDMKI
jgi:hypothetical protein